MHNNTVFYCLAQWTYSDYHWSGYNDLRIAECPTCWEDPFGTAAAFVPTFANGYCSIVLPSKYDNSGNRINITRKRQDNFF